MDLGDQDLLPICILGEGSFGQVFLCRMRKKINKLLCVKRIFVLNTEVHRNMIMDEIYIISQIKHPHIVQFERAFMHRGSVNIVMEYLPGGTIRDVINKITQQTLRNQSLLSLFSDILLGLEYLHIRHIIHRDLKPENLLLTSEQRVKIGDFGISAVYTDVENKALSAGTPLYAAPELKSGFKGDFTADIWSLGCVLYELCLGKHPFSDASDSQDLNEKIHARTSKKFNCQHIKHLCGDVWGTLCEKMLIYEANKRILIPDIMKLDPFLTINFYHKYFDYKY